MLKMYKLNYLPKQNLYNMIHIERGRLVQTSFFHGLICLAEPLEQDWSCVSTYIPSDQTLVST